MGTLSDRETIVRNSAICLECNEEIESKHRHDFVRCKCDSLAVDGGTDYLKRSYKPGTRHKDTSIVNPNSSI